MISPSCGCALVKSLLGVCSRRDQYSFEFNGFNVMAEILTYSLHDIKQDVYISEKLCTQRGLFHSAKWLAYNAFCSINVIKN